MSTTMTATAGSASPARAEWKSNWTVVLAAAFGMGLLSVPTYSMGLFFEPLENEFGWSRTSIAGGKLFGALSGLLVGPLIGLIVDRAGPQRLARVGSVLVCILIAMLSLAGPAITSWWLLWAMLSASELLIKPTVWTAGVSSTFFASRGLALAVALSGTVLASAFTPMLGLYLIDQYGWRSAFVALAGIWGLVALPIIFLFFDSARDRQRKNAMRMSDTSEESSTLPGVSPREGLLSLRFAGLAGASFIATLISASYVTTLVPVLVSTGINHQSAGAIAGIMGLTTVVGRLLSGYLSDRINANHIAVCVMLMPIAASSILLLERGALAPAAAAAVLLGFTLGAKLHFVAYLVTYHFGLRSFGVLFGTIAGLFGLATGVGPVALNYCYDKLGSYDVALMFTIPLSLTASALFLVLSRQARFVGAEA